MIEPRPFSEPRPTEELDRDESGQLAVEWILLTALVILPFGMMLPGILSMLQAYFYRIAGVISLPFP